ncbi:RHS repeat-associated core domain-containing protein [Dentiradicibacter hellwigii]|uniref:RHS repeat-associated core domain-containing protein n=1 Tax=Dentiradicibacter hellwigii TaxID=3149053 RepID=A0ABV4UF37_9RHOO
MAGDAQSTRAAGQPKLCEVYYFHTDPVGLPEELTNAQGQRIWQASYKTWGNTVREEWAYANIDGSPIFTQDQGQMPDPQAREQNLRFQGQYLDRDTGLHYNTFRYYDPDIGRFISPDPIGLNGGINLSSYAPNPVSWIDPWGWACQTTTNRLREHAAAARKEVYSDPQRMLSLRQRAAIKRAYDRGDLNQAHSRYRRYVGNQIDKRFKARVDADPDLAGKVSTTPAGKRGPDVIGEGPNQGQWWDLTTHKDWLRGGHQRKYESIYGTDYEGIFW